MELKAIVEELSCDIATLHVYDEANHSLELPIGYGLKDEKSFYDPRLPPRADRVAGITAARGAELFADDIYGTELDGPFARREQVLSAAALPLSSGNRKLGSLFISYRNQHSFSDAEKDFLRAQAQCLSRMVVEPGLLELVRGDRAQQRAERNSPFDTIVTLASNVLTAAVALWSRRANDRELTILAATQLPRPYLETGPVSLDDDDVLARVVHSNQPAHLTDLRDQPRYRPFADSSDRLTSLLAFPVSKPNRCEGVLEIVTVSERTFTEPELDTVRYLARIAFLALEAKRSAEQSRYFETVVAGLRAQPEVDQVMRGVVDAARDLTGADSAAIILRDLDDQEFVVAYRVPDEGSPRIAPRPEGGMTAHIVETGDPVLVSDNRDDSRVAKNLPEQGFLSMAGVRIEGHGERFGALYVDSRTVGQFDHADIERLRLLADHASTSLGWSRKLLRPYEEIEKATSALSHLDTIVNDICDHICKELGYDFATLQLIRKVENIIETVGGSGIGREWVGLARHYLHEDPELRDVQADIALSKPPRLEILAGWDDRFDRWLYERHRHDQIVRIIVPLILVRVADEEERVVDDWTAYCDLQQIRHDETEERRRTDLEIRIRHPESLDLDIEVIGTLEIGYLDRSRKLEHREAEALIPVTAKAAARVHQALLPSVLWTILENARRIVRASSASLHLYRRRHEEQNHLQFIHEVTAGKISKDWLEKHPPRQEGLGARAHDEGHALVVPDRSAGHTEDELKQMNPGIWEDGIRTIVALPLTVAEEQRVRRAVLYLHFRRMRWIQDDELGWLQLFARRAAEAIRQATLFERTRDRVSQFKAIQAVAQGLSTKVPEAGLLSEIANNALNILAADVVTIYEYDDDQYLEREKRFVFPPETAGRLLARHHMQAAVKSTDSPTLLVEHCLNEAEESEGPLLYFAANAGRDPIFLPKGRRERSDREPFIERERIASAAGVLLRVRSERGQSEIVAVMFVNYRRAHDLTDHERGLLESLASAAAISIKTRRMLEALGAGGREIINSSQPEQTLRSIVERAVHLTRADLGHVRLLDPKGRLVLTAHHPSHVELASHLEIGEGLSGWVAREGQPLLVEDTETSPHRLATKIGIRSALCLPLMDEKRHLVGVLGVGSYRPGTFSNPNQWLLRGLADDATLALVQADQHRQLIASETMAIFGELAFHLWHLATGKVALIRVLADRILEGDDRVQESAEEILDLSVKIIEDVRKHMRSLEDWTLDQVDAVNLGEAVQEALDQTKKPGHIEVSYDYPADLPRVAGRELQIKSIFTNLIENAFRAMPESRPGRLQIEAVEQDFRGQSYIFVDVKDNGIGIPTDKLKYVFDRGFSTSSSTGYGLWLSKMYIDRSHGRIEVTSEEGVGTQFHLRLPCYSDPES